MTTEADLRKLIQLKSVEFGIDPVLTLAMAEVESGINMWKTRYEPSYRYFYHVREFAEKLNISYFSEEALQRTSWNCLQIMGGTARDLGFKEDLTKLIIPDLGLHYGLMYLKTKLQKYGSEIDAVAAYNAGSVRMKNGMYENQQYVDKVYRRLVEHRKLN
jgi:hypothetical protein